MGGKFAVAQMMPVLKDVDGNLKKAANMVAAAKALGADVVLFPELFTTGYSFGLNVAEVAQPVPGPATDFLAEVAGKHGVYIYGSMIERDGKKLHNCGVFLDPGKGVIAKYYKAHLFGAEKDVFEPGEKAVIVPTRVGRIGLTICYDFAFPELTRGLVLQGAEVICNATNWLTVGPPQGWDPWQWSHLQTTAFAMTRALENTVGVAMCCVSGGLTEDIFSFGHSCIVSPSGRILAQLGEGEGVTVAEMPTEEVKSWRAIATYLPDRRADWYRKLLGY